MSCLQHVLALGGDLPKNDLFADRKALSSLVQRKEGGLGRLVVDLVGYVVVCLSCCGRTRKLQPGSPYAVQAAGRLSARQTLSAAK